ncbi:hypothetical protein [Streptomyces sp. SID13031]|uniref:hypothetical protein n=1 Tax=Streptomyces sp. SID13031 TaxID=2706046 RepID=UPI0013C80034|nr:hypothetical protein [Streptomyces sp. SID13031]NEA37575.1 hypothetical protein [Streptomyces sp. SID13031]
METADQNESGDSNIEDMLRGIHADWQRSSQEEVVLGLLNYVTTNPSDILIVVGLWLCPQAGGRGYPLGVEYAELAIQMEKPWLARNFAPALIANIPSYPDVFSQAIELARETSPYAPSADYVSIAWALIGMNKAEDAMQVLELTTDEVPFGESRIVHLREIFSEVDKTAEGIDVRAHQAIAMIDKVTADLTTKAKQTEILVENISSQATDARFIAEAVQNKKQSDRAYKWGLIVLAAASAMAVLPILLHYLSIGQSYNGTQVLGAHASATLALGTVAGVLLARARQRDRARQRATDISTAMGTIIVYSTQIESADERQKFLQTMGQLVLIAHLQADQSGADQTAVSVSDLMNALRTKS